MIMQTGVLHPKHDHRTQAWRLLAAHGVALRAPRGTHLLWGGADGVAEVHLVLDPIAAIALMVRYRAHQKQDVL